MAVPPLPLGRRTGRSRDEPATISADGVVRDHAVGFRDFLREHAFLC